MTAHPEFPGGSVRQKLMKSGLTSALGIILMTISADNNLTRSDAGSDRGTSHADRLPCRSADPECPPVSDAEQEQLRQERLAAIRQAVESGAYDSDDLLEKSLRVMLERIDDDTELQ